MGLQGLELLWRCLVYKRRQEIVNFMTPPQGGGGNFGGNKCKMYVLFKKSSSNLYSMAWFRQTKCIVIMIKDGSTKIVNFMTPVAGVLVLGHGHLIQMMKMHFFFKNFSLLLGIDQINWWYRNDDQQRIYQNCKFHDPQNRGFCPKEGGGLKLCINLMMCINIQHIDCYYNSNKGIYDAAFLCHCWFSFILWWVLLISKYEPFWQEVSVESLILRWPLRLMDLLFILSLNLFNKRNIFLIWQSARIVSVFWQVVETICIAFF